MTSISFSYARVLAVAIYAVLSVTLMLPSTAAFAQTPAESAQNQTAVPEAQTPKADIPVTIPEADREDKVIEQELQNIFSQDDALNEVAVRVRAGVVNLSGNVPNEASALEAKRLSTESEGVVKVQDNMTRTLALTDNVAPMIETTKKAIAGFIRAIPLMIFALLTLFFFIFIGNRLIRLKAFWKKIAPNPFLAELLGQAVRALFIVIGLVLALNIIGAKTIVTTVLGGAGVVGIALGFAVRDTIENYIASIMLSLRQPFRGGDHVLIDNHEGKVVRLTSRATILMTLDGNHLRIPNAQVFKAVIVNYTTNPERRFAFELGVDAADDPISAINTGLNAISGLDFVLNEPKPSAVISNVGDSNIVISFKAWVDQTHTDFGKARSFAIRAATTVLEDNGFSLPEPIYRLKLDTMAAKLIEKTPDTPTKTDPKKKDAPKKGPSPVKEAEPTQADVAPDKHLEEKVKEEQAIGGEHDLLDDTRPVE